MSGSKNVYIFDFDGTLADSVPIFRQIYSELAIKNKWKSLSDKDYEMLRRGSLRDARRWSGIRFWQYHILIRGAKRLMELEAEKVELFPGIAEIIENLHSKGCKLYVLSRNARSTIARVLERYGLEDKLEVLSRRKRTFGSKAAVISKLIRQNGYHKNYVWMVGDEVRDVQAANKAGVNSLAVAWGIQDISILERFDPTRTATTVKELKQVLLEIEAN